MYKQLATAAILTLPVLQLGIVSDAHAHRAWLLPQSTQVTGDTPMITFDAAVSNALFVADFNPLRPNGLAAFDHQGQPLELENVHTGRFRTNFDLTLAEQGTYRVASVSRGLSARWQDSEGNRGGFPGRGQPFNDAEIESAIPAGAENVSITLTSRRIETFVTNGAPDLSVIEPTGVGFEARYETHPNDLYSGESAVFQLLIDGEPAVGAEVTVIKDGMRYRDQQNEQILTSDSHGNVEINWESPGMYWVEATYTDDNAPAPATSRRGTYVVTLEVLPE